MKTQQVRDTSLVKQRAAAQRSQSNPRQTKLNQTINSSNSNDLFLKAQQQKQERYSFVKDFKVESDTAHQIINDDNPFECPKQRSSEKQSFASKTTAVDISK